MKMTDWYSRTLLTLIAGLLLVIATELRGIMPLPTHASGAPLANMPLRQGFQPQQVSLRSSSLELSAPAVMNVRIVGYKYLFNGKAQNVDFDNYTIKGEGLPTMSGEKLRKSLAQ